MRASDLLGQQPRHDVSGPAGERHDDFDAVRGLRRRLMAHRPKQERRRQAKPSEEQAANVAGDQEP